MRTLYIIDCHVHTYMQLRHKFQSASWSCLFLTKCWASRFEDSLLHSIILGGSEVQTSSTLHLPGLTSELLFSYILVLKQEAHCC